MPEKMMRCRAAIEGRCPPFNENCPAGKPHKETSNCHYPCLTTDGMKELSDSKCVEIENIP